MGRIAIVNDSEDTLEVFKAILAAEEHEFRTFAGPAKFLAEFREGLFDLVLLDLVMPVIDGFTVFGKIREKDQHVPVVAITACAGKEEREKALKAGFCDYFVKPILEIDTFRQTIHSHVGECANPLYGATPRQTDKRVT